MKNALLLALVCAFAQVTASAEEPQKFHLERLPIAATVGPKTEWILTLRGQAFRNVEELKSGIERLPKGAEIVWAPSCDLIGGEPLYKQSEMDEILALCKSRGIVFTVIPSG